MIVLKDLEGPPTYGISIDEDGRVCAAEQSSNNNPDLTVAIDFKTLTNIFNGKIRAEDAFCLGMIDLHGAHWLADLLLLREFMRRLEDEEKKELSGKH